MTNATKTPAVATPGARDNGWTGGQYSLWRALLGTMVLLYTWRAAIDTYMTVSDRSGDLETYCRWLNSPNTPITILSPQLDLIAMGALGVLLLLGTWDRIAALVLAVAFYWSRHQGRVGSSHLFPDMLQCALVFHAAMPGAPYLSRKAVGRDDPAGGWRFSRAHGIAIRVVFAALLARSAAFALSHQLEDPLAYKRFLHDQAEFGTGLLHALGTWSAEPMYYVMLAQEILALMLVPLAFWPRGRKFYWCVLALALLLAPPIWGHLNTTMLVYWILSSSIQLGITFDPAWIRPRGGDVVEHLFYDGECGLCQRAVRFVLAEDPDGVRFRFAPLQGETFARALTAEERAALPDSVVVLTADGRRLVRSDAAIHVLERLGGAWRVLGMVNKVVPRGLRDGVYDLVAGMRKRMFAAPKVACPLGPKHVTDRFDF